MNKGYMTDMKIVDQRLTACEEKMKKLEKILKKILNILKEIKDA